MVCKNCGFENESNAVFCANCGASLEIEEGTSVLFEETQNEQTESYDVQNDYIVPPYSEEQDYSTPVFEAEAYNPNGTVEKKKDDSKLGFIFGLVGFILSTTCCCALIPFVAYVEWIFTIAAVVLGVIGLVKAIKAIKQVKETGEKNIFPILGIVFSSLAIVIGLLSTAYIIFSIVYALFVGVAYSGAMLFENFM